MFFNELADYLDILQSVGAPVAIWLYTKIIE